MTYHNAGSQDELFRLEQELKVVAADELRAAKEAAAAHLNQTVADTEQRCEEIRQRDVEQARIEERQKSHQEIEDLKRYLTITDLWQ